jgi:hypothetical protein
MSTQIRSVPGHFRPHGRDGGGQVVVYGHSAVFYWWPLWVAGYVMALLTWLTHDEVVIGNKPEWFHPSRNPGVIYTLLFLMLIVLTSTRVKGMKAALIIVALSFVALLFVHLNWWERILGWLGYQSISLSLGFYLWSSSLLLLVWLTTVFFIDRLSFWRFRPGQVTHEYIGGIVNNSYDTDTMTISLNRQDDFFRHWVIGLGSGDLHLRTMGGQGVEMDVANVLFVGTRIFEIERLIATVPDVPKKA